MPPRPSFDPELLVVIALGLVLILGLGWIFLPKGQSEPASSPTVEPTLVPFDPTPLKSRTPSPVSASPTLAQAPTATATSPVSYPGPPTETLALASTLITESGPTSSAMPTSYQAQPLPAGRFDDTNPNIVYDRYWVFRMNSGTKYAYKGTLHTSNSIGNEITFLFTGQRVYLGYQRGRSFGTVKVIIDDQTYSFHEQAFDKIWRSPQLDPGIHSVRILHDSGESVNLDYIEVWP